MSEKKNTDETKADKAPTRVFLRSVEQLKGAVIDRQPVSAEANAITIVAEALDALDAGGKQRVLNYMRERVQDERPTREQLEALLKDAPND
ncbi:hypothetical protein [Hyphomonas sp.]|uniref:hypothetical protein n=1 Tax=Hyphomonas sp. TaxID=87 RepID=UPI003002D5B1